MAKAMLIMDMPSNCNNCPLRISISDFVLHSLDIANICGKTKKVLKNLNEKPTWCPLHEVPKKKGLFNQLPKYDTDIHYEQGYNACIDIRRWRVMKCDNCIHEDICIHRGNMEKFESEIRDKERLLENKCFHADIRCDNFSRKNTVNIR